jgi:hypothetical protein
MEAGRRGAGFADAAGQPPPSGHHVERWKAGVIMPKPRSTIPIAHADDVPPIAFADEKWQAIEQAYGRQCLLQRHVQSDITSSPT